MSFRARGNRRQPAVFISSHPHVDAPQTIADIGPLWDFKPIDAVRVRAQRIDTRVIVGEREDCIVAAFAGTARSIAI